MSDDGMLDSAWEDSESLPVKTVPNFPAVKPPLALRRYYYYTGTGTRTDAKST